MLLEATYEHARYYPAATTITKQPFKSSQIVREELENLRQRRFSLYKRLIAFVTNRTEPALNELVEDIGHLSENENDRKHIEHILSDAYHAANESHEIDKLPLTARVLRAVSKIRRKIDALLSYLDQHLTLVMISTRIDSRIMNPLRTLISNLGDLRILSNAISHSAFEGVFTNFITNDYGDFLENKARIKSALPDYQKYFEIRALAETAAA
ncbi:MAG: hypothetical protein AABW54_04745 [Candidatus Micrarchaeota archaeon]